MKYRPTMLMILDGWGESARVDGNAVIAANTPNLDRIQSIYPRTTIKSSGLAVGLPEGQMGNSEVGHLNIGAGRTVYQALTKITKAIHDGDFFSNPALLAAMDNAAGTHADGSKKSIHLMGLLSDGGVHSHIEHLYALIEMAKKKKIEKIYVHAFLDGRDTPPRSADGFLADLEKAIDQIGAGEIALISGRFYAMDRDNRWDRVEKAYDALTLGEGLYADNATQAINDAYKRGEDDEFVVPTVIHTKSTNPAIIEDGDSVVFFNFRPDRAREITRALVDPAFDGFARKKAPKDLTFVCMTQYDESMPGVLVAYPPESLDNTLGEYLASKGLTQLRIAETEKYAHVTFFFNGGVEKEEKGEDRILIPSPKVATYDMKPEMSANEVGDAVITQIKDQKYDVIILNFANMDMVGHTGSLEAAIKAVETVDANVGRIVDTITNSGGQLIITADHGNSEQMLDEEGNVFTAHSTNPVPLVIVRNDASNLKLREGGALSDIAPTLLDMMELDVPEEMSGTSLIVK
ncbi:MAG: 2,3-bisphosphoglycerate-independent phosphoglycerate mutase [Clostridiales Family XIII bacterium]|jgi:2,3-bisphosphoglycerate-independent phosphoglycerate mutase|nr:2,3-bisphosphoglycerate-independent phosphoglycerate mutase [Clostridiales Family XIII bacterium]